MTDELRQATQNAGKINIGVMNRKYWTIEYQNNRVFWQLNILRIPFILIRCAKFQIVSGRTFGTQFHQAMGGDLESRQSIKNTIMHA